MGLISNGTTLLDAGSVSAAKGALTLIKTLTASSSATLSFVHGASDVVLDGTYKEYIFKWTGCHPATNNVTFTAGFRDGSTDYDATITSNTFNASGITSVPIPSPGITAILYLFFVIIYS